MRPTLYGNRHAVSAGHYLAAAEKAAAHGGREAGLEAARKDLEGRGHRLDISPDYTRNAAAVEVIVAEPKPGFLRAGADPRQPAYAIVR